MPLALVAALAAAPTALPNCSWDRPGHNAFMGDVVAAVDRYQDIPVATRAKLKSRMAARQYDEIVSIRRDSIQGQARYDSDIRDMHFGAGQTCGTVSRAAWAPDLQERGLVYCEDGQCILVPTVCRNVSRITRASAAAGPALAGAGPTGGGGGGGGGGSGEGPSAVAAGLPAAGLGGMPAGQNAPDSFARSAGIGKAAEGGAGAAVGGTGLGGAGDVGPGGAVSGGTAAGGSGALGTASVSGALPGGPPPLWASVGAGALLAGLTGGNSGGTAAGNSDSFASGSGAAGGGAAGSGSATAGGLPAGSGSATGTGAAKLVDGALPGGTTSADNPLGGLLAPTPAAPGLFLPGTDAAAAIPEAHSGWMMALGAALLLVWLRPWVRPLVKRVS